MISLIIPTTTKNQNYTDNIISNIRSIYPDETQVEIILEQSDTVTLGVNYNNAVARASGEKIILLHNDMIIKSGFIEQMDKDIVKNRITTYTRVEPPIFNDIYPGKVLLDCGTDLDSFNSSKFNEYVINSDLIDGGSQLFFGCMREDYIGIDGYTFKMFCEDDDLHMRYRLAGFEHKVSPAHVYHFVSKTSRTTSNYQQIELASNRNFIRKWGTRNTNSPTYDIAFILNNSTDQLLEILEPWCNRIWVDTDPSKYILMEQQNTVYDLTKRVHLIENSNPNEYHDIVVEIDAKTINDYDFNVIQNLAAIIKNSGEAGYEFKLGNLKINIQHLNEYQNTLIHI